MHVSIKAIGWIVGGPDVVLHSILDVISYSGTVMMITRWEESTYHIDGWPKARRQAYLEECPSLDPARSRALTREMGMLPEYLPTWPGALRGGHPESSFTAFGASANW
ncbi:MAG: AAC(3) family N-acetyltransferase, partial [SAR202 cluster bacterium]|nr:AAC(3) family N-acetyltransferase [SAR202 cluster bacterium]